MESTAVAVDLEKSVFRFAVADYLIDLGIEEKLPPVKQVRRSVRRNTPSGFDTPRAARVDGPGGGFMVCFQRVV